MGQLTAAAVASGMALAQAALPAQGVPAGRFATPSVAQSIGVQVEPWHTSATDLERIHRLGVGVIRWGFAWAEIEPRRGEYDWSGPDRFMAMARAANLRSVVILGLDNPAYQAAPPNTPEGVQAFARFAAAAATRYRNDGVAWELWNEPDLARFWPPRPDSAAYARLASAGCRAIKAREPGATVIGPASARLPDPFDQASWAMRANLHESGAWSCLDAISAHFYHLADGQEPPRPSAVAPYARIASRWTARRMGGAPARALLCTEWGYSHPGALPPGRAADAIKMPLLNLLSGVPLTVIYEWRDHGTNPADPEDHYGLVDYDGRDKGGVALLSQFLQQAGAARVTGRYETDAANVYVVALAYPNGSRAVAAWSESRPEQLTIDGRGPYALTPAPQLIPIGDGPHRLRISAASTPSCRAPAGRPSPGSCSRS